MLIEYIGLEVISSKWCLTPGKIPEGEIQSCDQHYFLEAKFHLIDEHDY